MFCNTAGEVQNVQSQGYASFDVGEYRFKVHKRPIVLRMAPYIRTNEDEEASAHAMLLLYVPWPKEGETNLFRGEPSAVLAFAKLKAEKQLPLHVLTQIEAFKRSDEILNDIGDVAYTGHEELMGDDDNNAMAEAAKEFSDVDSDSETENDLPDMNEDHTEPATIIAPAATTDTPNTNSTMDTAVEIITDRLSTYYKDFVDNQLAAFMNEMMHQNSTSNVRLAESMETEGNSTPSPPETATTTSSTADQRYAETSNTTGKVPLNNEEQRKKELRVRVDRMTPDQRQAYDELLEYILGKRQSLSATVIQFISGGAGVGKSEYIKCLIETVRLYYGKQPGLYGSVIIMGPTGSSAHNIGGFTWQSLLGKGFDATMKNQNQKNQSQFLSQEKAEQIYKRIKGVKLIIIDEVSMVGLEALHEISQRICEAICTSIVDRTERTKISKKPFAGITTVLYGDLYQLGCIKATPIYATGDLNTAASAGRKIWRSITMFHDFRTSTRFAKQKDTTNVGNTKPLLESFLNGARVGNPTQYYLNAMNTQICINYEDAYRRCNKKAVWLASTHKEVDEINRFMYGKLKKMVPSVWIYWQNIRAIIVPTIT